MSVGYGDAESLARQVRLLDNEVDGLRDELRQLDGRVDSELGELRIQHDRRIGELEDDLADTTQTADSAAARVDKLADRVEWLSRYIRLGGGAREVDLDSVGEDIRRDLVTAAAGRRAAGTLLAEDRRHALEATIDLAADARTRWQRTADNLLEHSRHLASTPLDPRRPAVLRGRASQYRAAVQAYRTSITNHDRATAAADAARRQLDDDDDRRRTRQPAIDAGEAADTRARTTVRTRIAEAISGEALLPEWFVVTLGFRPARGTAVGAWMDLATDVLAYRITYSITSHTDALGPDQPDDADRTRWYQQLRRKLTP